MKRIGWIAALGTVGLLTACSGTPDCLKHPGYVDAKALPPLQAPAGLSVPKSDAHMSVPDVREGPVSAYATAPEGTEQDNEQARCLTTPPPLPAS